ncbi:MAG: hypothetical protein Q7S19_01055 [bacterium]|nr:hypothetical protein [bacterium]
MLLAILLMLILTMTTGCGGSGGGGGSANIYNNPTPTPTPTSTLTPVPITPTYIPSPTPTSSPIIGNPLILVPLGVTDISSNSVTLQGNVAMYAGWLTFPVDLRFEWDFYSFGRIEFANQAPLNPPSQVGNVSINITGLMPGTRYNYRLVLVIHDGVNTTWGSDVFEFTTSSGTSPTATPTPTPTAIPQPLSAFNPTEVTVSSAVLQGNVQPYFNMWSSTGVPPQDGFLHAPPLLVFQYGVRMPNINDVIWTSVPVPPFYKTGNISTMIIGLLPNTTYVYRVFLAVGEVRRPDNSLVYASTQFDQCNIITFTTLP